MKKTLIVLIATALFATNANAQSSTTKTTITNETITAPPEGTPAPATTPPAEPAPAPATQPAPAEPAPAPAPVEEVKAPVFYIGARVLGSVSSFKVNTSENNGVTTAKTSTMLGYGGGFYFGFNVTKHFAIQPELLYSTLSQEYVDKGLDRRIDLAYVNIPLMFVYNTNITKPVNFNIALGPQLGINTGAEVSSTSQGSTEVVNSKFAVKATDIGFAYGAGFDFRISPALSIGIGYRGVTGLLDISDENSTATYSTTDSNGVTTVHTIAVLDESKVRTNGAYVGLRLNF